MHPDALNIEALGHHYDGKPTFEDVTFSVKPGEFVCVLGSSGCGKSTLLRSVAGLVTPQRGQIGIHGNLVARDGRDMVRTENRQIGLVFQDYALFPYHTVAENISFGISGNTEPEQTRLEWLLDLTYLQDYASTFPAELSGGQQQRTALARAIAPKPRLLLLDEPFANVDATLRHELGEELRLIVFSERTSVLMVTHDRTEAMALADRIAILATDDEEEDNPGPARLAQFDTPERLYRLPATRAVASLTGTAFFLPATTDGKKAMSKLGNVPIAQKTRGDVDVVLRPESVAFTVKKGGSCRVVSRRFYGRAYRLFVHTPAGEFMVETMPGEDPPEPGTEGEVKFVQPCATLAV